jgi:hypothetical protein
LARLIYILVFAVAFSAVAQSPQKRVGETMFIDTNTTNLLAGETLYYSVFCLTPDGLLPSAVSKIAYVEIIDSNLKIVERHQIGIENAVGQGDFFIPATLPSGSYKLVGYTLRMLGISNKNFFSADLTIVNPFRKFEGKIDADSPVPNTNVRPATALLNVTTDKNVYAPREKVVLKLNRQPGLNGHFSLSVKKIDGFNKPNLQATAFEPAFKNRAVIGLPEMRGKVISGKIVTVKNGKNAENKNVALSIPGRSFEFKITQSDRDGRFVFVLDKALNRSQAVIQVMENDREEYAIVFDQDKKPDYSGLMFSAVKLDKTAEDAISQRTVALQIENAYFDVKKDSVLRSPDLQPFYHPLEKTYVLDDFTRFPTIKETIIEVVREMYFTRRRDKYEIHLRNTTMNNEQFGQALILVDGLLIQNHDELFSYGAKYIEKVDLINEPYVYGPKTFSGVANFTTKLEDFKSNATGGYIQKFNLDLPQPHKNYFSPDYSQGKSRIPDYRHQLLWVPNLAENMREISFYTSDISGEFLVEIQGFTETGTPISTTATFRVQ